MESLTQTKNTNFVNQLHNDQLENVPESVNLVNAGAQVVQSSILLDINVRLNPQGPVLSVYQSRRCKPDRHESAS